MAAITIGSLETTLGRYDDALHQLDEARDLAEGSGGTWITAGSRVQLGILDILRHQPDQARPLLDEALDLSLAARSAPLVAHLCLAGYAQLAFAEGDPQRAARLQGAAEGAAPALRPASVAASAAGRGRTGEPGPPQPGRGPVRPGVHRRLRANPAGGGSYRPGSTQHRHPDILSCHADNAEIRPGHHVRRRPGTDPARPAHRRQATRHQPPGSEPGSKAGQRPVGHLLPVKARRRPARSLRTRRTSVLERHIDWPAHRSARADNGGSSLTALGHQ